MVRKITSSLSRISLIVFIVGFFLTVLDFTESGIDSKYSSFSLLESSDYRLAGIVILIAAVLSLISVIIVSEKGVSCLVPLSVFILIIIAHLMFRQKIGKSAEYAFFVHFELFSSNIYGCGMITMLWSALVSGVLSIISALMPVND